MRALHLAALLANAVVVLGLRPSGAAALLHRSRPHGPPRLAPGDRGSLARCAPPLVAARRPPTTSLLLRRATSGGDAAEPSSGGEAEGETRLP